MVCRGAGRCTCPAHLLLYCAAYTVFPSSHGIGVIAIVDDFPGVCNIPKVSIPLLEISMHLTSFAVVLRLTDA
jgi:hypothetical protein